MLLSDGNRKYKNFLGSNCIRELNVKAVDMPEYAVYTM